MQLSLLTFSKDIPINVKTLITIALRLTATLDSYMNNTIPIFITTYNQKSYITKVIDSYRSLSSAIDIIIHDNGSDDEEMVSLLRDLERDGVIVNRDRKIKDASELSRVNLSINKYFKSELPTSDYVVTDPDIDLTDASPDTLNVYRHLLNTSDSEKVHCVGPMLRIDDIPTTYPLRISAINGHIRQFWAKVPDVIETPWGEVAIQNARIDTTFALHRAKHPFSRLRHGLRVYRPYEARHLDWYINARESKFNETTISHWADSKLIEKHKTDKLEHQFFYNVEHRSDKIRSVKYIATQKGCYKYTMWRSLLKSVSDLT